MALEALSEYTLNIPQPPVTTINAQFTVTGRSEIENLLFDNKETKVEAELKVKVFNFLVTLKSQKMMLLNKVSYLIGFPIFVNSFGIHIITLILDSIFIFVN